MITKWIESELKNIYLRRLNKVLNEKRSEISTAIVDCYSLKNEPDRILVDVIKDTSKYATLSIRLIYNNRPREDIIKFKINSDGDFNIN